MLYGLLTAAALGLIGLGVWPGDPLLALATRLSSDGQLSPDNQRVVRATARLLLPAGLLLGVLVAGQRYLERALRRFLERLAAPSPGAFLAAVLLGAATLRFLWIALVPSLPVSDSLHYHELAAGLAETGRYLDTEGHPTAFWPPGYPVLLSTIYLLFGKGLLAPKIVNVGFGCATVLLTYLVARRAAGEAVGRLASILVAVFPSQIGHTSLLCTEIPFTALMLLFLFAMGTLGRVEPRRAPPLALVLGLFLGAIALMRPQVALLPAATCLVLARQTDGLRALQSHGVLAVAMLAVILPWGFRNERAVHGFVPFSTNAGVNFYYGNNPWTNGTGFEFRAQVKDQTEGVRSEVARNRRGFQLGMNFWREQPLQAVVLAGRKLVMMMLSDGTWTAPALRETARPMPPALWRVLVAVSNAVYWPILLLFGLEWLVFRRRREARAAADPFLDAFFLYTLLITAFWLGREREHFPLVPILCLGTATLLGRLAVSARAFRATSPNLAAAATSE